MLIFLIPLKPSHKETARLGWMHAVFYQIKIIPILYKIFLKIEKNITHLRSFSQTALP